MPIDVESPILLDTCAVIWVVEDAISPAAVEWLNASERAGIGVHISPISAWELGLLASRGKLKSPLGPQRLFARILDLPYARLAQLSAEILILSSFLPGSPPRDPADRILAATAREYGYRLMTCDRVLLAYAEQGHLQAVSC